MENLEIENGHGKELAKGHGVLLQSWNFTNFVPEFDQICAPFADIIGGETSRICELFIDVSPPFLRVEMERGIL